MRKYIESLPIISPFMCLLLIRSQSFLGIHFLYLQVEDMKFIKSNHATLKVDKGTQKLPHF